MQLRKKVLSATIALSGFMALGRALDLIGTLIVARLVAPEAFGVVASALIVMQFTASLTELNVFEALIQKKTVAKADYDTAFTFSVMRGGIIALVMLIAAFPVAHVFGQPDIVPVIASLSVVHLILTMRSPKVVEYSRRVEPAIPAAMEFASRLIGFAVTVILAVKTSSYWAIPCGLIVGNTLLASSSYVVAPYRPGFSLEKWRWLISFAGWMNLHSVTNAVGGQFDRFSIGMFLGEVIVGIYTIATSIASQLLWSLAAPIMNALFAGLASIKDDLNRLRNGYLLSQQILVAFMMPIGVGLALVSDRFVLIVLGPEWEAAAPVISIVAPATALQMSAVGAHALGLALGQPKQLFIRNFLSLCVGIPLTIFGISLSGVHGAAIARAAMIIIFIALHFQLVKHLIGLSILRQLGNCLRTLLSCALMALVVFWAKGSVVVELAQSDPLLELSLLVSIGAISYASIHFLLWVLADRPDGPEGLVTRTVRDLGRSLLRRGA